MTIVLLPGMDGTGELFSALIATLPATVDTLAVRYPVDRSLPYVELDKFVRSKVPESEPFVLLAESFSTPLAIQIASTNLSNLKALILCAGFATSPVQGWRRWLLWLLAPIIFRLQIPKLGIRLVLVGWSAPRSSVEAIRSALRQVRPEVLSKRLRAVLDCNVNADLSRLSVPILYLQGCQDRLVKGPVVQEVVRSNPQTVLKQIEGPHLILQREPELSAKLIWKFIEEL